MTFHHFRKFEVAADLPHLMQVFIACGISKPRGPAEDPYRKPKTGMWNVMAKNFNSGISIDMDK